MTEGQLRRASLGLVAASAAWLLFGAAALGVAASRAAFPEVEPRVREAAMANVQVRWSSSDPFAAAEQPEEDPLRGTLPANRFVEEPGSGVREKAPEWPPRSCLEDYREQAPGQRDHQAGFNSGRWVAQQRFARMLRQRAADEVSPEAARALRDAAEAAELGDF